MSYHHRGDQPYYDRFSSDFHDLYEAVSDNSLERRVDSLDVDYVMRRIREHHLWGSSCTVVLCGRETPRRKYVDWEIEASLDQRMGLLAILLPTIQCFPNGGTAKPARLQDNIDSGYAGWVTWNRIERDPSAISAAVERATEASRRLIVNTRLRMLRNG